MKLYRRIFLLISVILILAAATRAAAQEVAPIADSQVTYVFGEQFTITGAVDPQAEYASIDVHITFPGDPRILSVPIVPGPTGAFTFTHLVSDRFIRAFATVTYEFILTDTDGAISEIGPFSFYYADNRFEWQDLEA
jgi:hypothetical protein